jgi:hypothetical protein
MLKTFSAGQVTADVLAHLERRRPAIVHDDAAIRSEVLAALEPVRREYADMDLPARYFDALENELLGAIPARWRQIAEPFTEEERRGFGVWRGGDVFARLLYVGVGLLASVFAARILPSWQKWLPFLFTVGAWWLPDLQAGSRRRRYAHQLGEIVAHMEQAQRQLERQVTTEDLIGGDIDRLRAARRSPTASAAEVSHRAPEREKP